MKTTVKWLYEWRKTHEKYEDARSKSLKVHCNDKKKKKERPAIVMYMEQKTVQTGYLHVLDTWLEVPEK